MRADIVELFDQILRGDDIPAPESVVKIKLESAFERHDRLPYSLATNLRHTVLWQRFWLNKLSGGRKKSGMAEWKEDFREPGREEWEGLRTEFLDGLVEARRIAASDPMEHSLDSDDEAVHTLICIAVHGAYHMGQMNLLRRASRGR